MGWVLRWCGNVSGETLLTWYLAARGRGQGEAQRHPLPEGTRLRARRRWPQCRPFRRVRQPTCHISVDVRLIDRVRSANGVSYEYDHANRPGD